MKTLRISLRPGQVVFCIVLAASSAYAAEKAVLDTVYVEGTRNTARYRYVDTEGGETAAKTSIPAGKVPYAVHTVTRRHLDEREPQDIAGTLSYTGGVSGGYRGENTHLEMSVRGTGNKSDGGASPLYWDGMAYSAGLELSPYALEKIDVLKGPASVLYGQGNPGGIVNLISKTPTGSGTNEIIAKTGSGSRAQLGLDIDRSLNDNLDYRIVAEGRQSDWQEKHVRQRALMLAPSFTWKPGPDTSLTLLGFYERRPEAGNRNFLPAAGTLYPVGGLTIARDLLTADTGWRDINNTHAHTGYRFSHRFNDAFTLRQNLRYSRTKDYLKSLIVWGDSVGTEVPRKARIFDDNIREFQIDTQGETRFSTGPVHHTLLAGVDYRRLSSNGRYYLGDAPGLDWANPVYGVYAGTPDLVTDEHKMLRQTGFYLQNQAEAGRLNILLGSRYDRASSTTDDFLTGNFSRDKDGKFTWRAGAVYNFGNGLSPYASYSTSFLPEAGTDAEGSRLKPTTAAQYEVGVKYRPSPAILLTAAGFDIRQKNIVVYDPVTRDKGQRGKIRTRGAEVEFQGDITPAWGVSGSYTYLDKNVTADSNADYLGTTPWGIPEHSVSLWSDYRFRRGILSGLSVGLGMRYTGRTWGDNENTYRVPSYLLWDAKLAYQPGYRFPSLKGSTVQLNMQNLAGKQYVSSCASTRKDTCFYGRGRVTVLSLGYRW